jgi:hypothetical protein
MATGDERIGGGRVDELSKGLSDNRLSVDLDAEGRGDPGARGEEGTFCATPGTGPES